MAICNLASATPARGRLNEAGKSNLRRGHVGSRIKEAIDSTFRRGTQRGRLSAILLETNDEWAVQRSRYMSLETIAPLSDDALVSLPAIPA